jgi:hypothetical protein
MGPCGLSSDLAPSPEQVVREEAPSGYLVVENHALAPRRL